MEHKRFHYKSMDDLKQGADLHRCPAAAVRQPRGTGSARSSSAPGPCTTASPSSRWRAATARRTAVRLELTLRRYDRFARSGAGLIWAEAVAITPEGRANPRQLWLTKGKSGRLQEVRFTI